MSNRMFMLMKLAWDRCSGDINTVLNFIIGGAVFVGMLVIYVLLNLGTNFPGVTVQPIPAESVPIFFAYWYSLSWGFVNAVCMLLFLAILICLAEYTYNFIVVCWYYDNQEWEIPIQIKHGLKYIDNHFKQVGKANREQYVKSREQLISEVSAIKEHNSKQVQPVQPVQTIQPIFKK